MRYARAARRLVALSTVVMLVTPFAPALSAPNCGTSSGNWTVIPGPSFPAGPAAMTDLAIDERVAGRVFATNGRSVMRSTDGGCSWQHSYTVGEESAATYTPASARIVKIEVGPGSGRVYAAIAETVVNQTRPHIVVSPNAGRSWQSGDAGLPPLGSPEALVVASSSPDTAYLALDLGGGTIDSIWASSDGGRTWEARDQHLGGEFVGLEVDPLAPSELWAYGNGLHHSTDGGRTFTPVDEFVGVTTGPVGVFHERGRPATLFVFIPSDRSLRRSVDGGENWLENYGLPAPTSITHGLMPDSALATSGGDVYGWVPALFTWAALRAPTGGLTDAQATRAASPEFYFRNATQIAVYSGPAGGDIPTPNREFLIGNISLVDDPPSVVARPPELSPGDRTVKIPAGKRERVTYDLSLSKVRTPLDLYFLVDTSESATKFLKGLAVKLGEIINELTLARLDVRFGLGEFRAYPDSTPPRPYCGNDGVPVVENPNCERNFVYRRVLDLPDYSTETLETAIENLEPVAGGHYEASLEALYQTATGAGEDVWPQGTTDSHLDGHDVPKGQQANFREKALKVVLIATDEGFENAVYGNDDFPPDLPSHQQVIDAFQAHGEGDDGIRQIGLALGTGALRDMQEIARGTGAVAPAEGADCDGDGVAEIVADGPLVCTVQSGSLEQGGNLAPAIVNLVEAVRNSQAVTLDVTPEDRRVVAAVTPDEYPGVAAQADADLKFDVTYECPTAMAGERIEVRLAASRGADPLDRATTTIVCGKVPEDKKKNAFFDLFPFDRVLGLVPLLPLSPPPTLANPSQATQAQSQAQAQGAMATQEQEQPQVALATQYKSALREALARDEEYAMTRYRERSSTELPPPLFLAAAALMASASYVALSRRRRIEPARARR